MFDNHKILLRCVCVSHDLDLLRAQRIMGLFILITHKSTGSANSIWITMASHYFFKSFVIVKPWPNGLASFGLAFNFRFVWPPTCDDLRGLWSSSNLDASFLPFGHPAQVDTSWSQVICCYKINQWYAWNFFATCKPTCESVWPPFASSGFANLRRLASPFGQGLNLGNIIMLIRNYFIVNLRFTPTCIQSRDWNT